MRESTTDLSAATPAEIDANLAVLWQAEDLAKAQAANYTKIAGERWHRSTAHYEELAEAERVKARQAREQAKPFEAEFKRRGGWLRYFLVTNGNGHVHRGTDCSTCFPTTRFAWLTDLADCDENEMVDEWGEKACTVCFPNAPTNPRFYEPSRQDQAARAEREAEKAKREAAKVAKAQRIAEREAKATAKAAADAKAKAEGTYKLTASEKREAAIAAISEACQAGDWDRVLALVQDAKALGKTERWQSALRVMESTAKSDEGRRFFWNAVMGLGWAL